MAATIWNTPLDARWHRALDLKGQVVCSNGCLLVDLEDESGKSWRLTFENPIAWKVTSEENAFSIVENLPIDAAMFVIDESEWIDELCAIPTEDNFTHFVLCCYDEVLEVAASECRIQEHDVSDS